MNIKKTNILLAALTLFLIIGFGVIAFGNISTASNYDGISPAIGSVRLMQNELLTPGKLTIELSDIIEDQTGITKIRIKLLGRDFVTGEKLDPRRDIGYTEVQLSLKSSPLFTCNHYTVSIPIPSTLKSGLYYISVIEATDLRGNEVYYGNQYIVNTDNYTMTQVFHPNENPNQSCNVYGRVKIYSDEFDTDLAISNPNLSTQIQNMKDGDVARIFVDGTGKTIIPKSVFEAIKGTHKKILVKTKEGINWLFEGQDIIRETKDIDCKVEVSMIQNPILGTDKQLMQLNFASNGSLPGKAKIRLKSDYLYQLYNFPSTLSLYYLDVNAKWITLESPEINIIIENRDYWCEFDVTHNSTFFLSQFPLSYTENGNPEAPGIRPTIKLNVSALPLQLGKSTTVLKISHKTSGDAVNNWFSSKPNIVSVNKKSGKITAKKMGIAYITVKMKSGASAKCKVKVQKNAVKTKKLSVNKKSVTLKRKKSFSIKTTRTPLTTSDKLTYTSSNKKVATVTAKGKVKTLKSGKTKITIKSGKKKVKINIKVK